MFNYCTVRGKIVAERTISILLYSTARNINATHWRGLSSYLTKTTFSTTKQLIHTAPTCFQSSAVERNSSNVNKNRQHPNYIYFHSSCTSNTKDAITSSFIVVKEFIDVEEENVLMKEVEPHLKRKKYEFDHWDDAIHGFREIERSRWGKGASIILNRTRELAFPESENQLPQTHVLDLDQTGVIKPHVDSVRFCGDIICGLCLLSDAVMRLVHVEQKDQIIDILLQRRSLYIMKNESRYNYTHEVLSEKDSYFGTEAVPRGRRISFVSRNHPKKHTHDNQPT